MSQHQDDVIPDSTYPPLEPPGEFKSQIPEHLLTEASPTDRYMLEQMSILRQHNEWSMKAHLGLDKNVRMTNGRLRRAEDDIKNLKGESDTVKIGWKLIAKVAGVIVGAITLAATVYQVLHTP